MNDQAQRKQALDITKSYIVQAPAGSGKTELLTQRYLKLLSVCEYPENIMAMTFTNKAVDELRQRVLSALQSTQQPRPNEAHKQITYDLAAKVIQHSERQGWALLHNPKRLKIATIDSLSSLISSRYPVASELVPRQIMLKNWQQVAAYKHATMQTLLLIDDKQYGAVISDLLLYLDNNIEQFYRLTTQMLAKRDQWLTRLYRDDVLDPSILQDSAKTIIVQHLSCLERLAKPHLNSNFFALMSASTKAEYAQLDCLPGCALADFDKWQSIQSLCLKKDGAWRKTLNKNNGFPAELKAQKQALIEQLQILSENEALRAALHNISHLPDADFSVAQVDTLALIAQVLKLCVAQLSLYFEQQQAHDFIEVALLANQALDNRSSVSDIALFLDYKIQHLLIDEFQDTSTLQFDSIEKLIGQWQDGDGKTLFLVGDPMQSIYRFRESQVGLFLQVKAQGIANIAPTSLLLNTNFRSSKSIVAGNNTLFQQIFPEYEDIYQGAISYLASQAASDVVNNQAISFYPFAHNQSELEAESVLNIVKTSLADNAQAELVILVRNRSHLQNIIPLLKQSNIAFEGVKIIPLKEHLLTRDLFSLTKALLHLGDKLAWLSVLRSPWCGLILDDLLILSADNKTVIYQQLADENTRSLLTKDGQKRAQHLYDCLRPVLDNQGRFSFVELLTYALQQLGITAALSSTEAIIKDQFLQIINDCESQQLLNVATIETILNELYAPSEKARVKLMTIHESKGLEFDTVILPGLGKLPANNKSPMMHLKTFADESLLLAPIKSSTEAEQSRTYNYLGFVDAEQNKFETMRLLYVAMTRAKQHLHLLGALNQSEKAPAKSLLALLIPFYQASFEQKPVTECQTKPADAPQLQRLKQLTTPHNKAQIIGQTIKYQQSFERLFKRLIGTLIHAYYQQQIFSPSSTHIKNRLIEIGTPATEIERWQSFIVKLLNNTTNDPKFAWLFKSRSSTLTEAEFVVNEKTIAIDRLFIDDDILWIIDFKTTEPASNEALEAFISRQQSEHTAQLLLYQQTLSQIYPNKIKCALYCPAVSQLIEVNLPTAH